MSFSARLLGQLESSGPTLRVPASRSLRRGVRGGGGADLVQAAGGGGDGRLPQRGELAAHVLPGAHAGPARWVGLGILTCRSTQYDFVRYTSRDVMLRDPTARPPLCGARRYFGVMVDAIAGAAAWAFDHRAPARLGPASPRAVESHSHVPLCIFYG